MQRETVILQPHLHFDEPSPSSTFLVVDVLNKGMSNDKEIFGNDKNEMKTVSFNLKRNEYNIDFGLYTEDIHKLWYRQDDFERFKDQNRAFIRKIIRADKTDLGPESYLCSIERAYKISCSLPSPEAINIEIDEDSTICMLHMMGHWLSFAPERLGVERLASRSLRNDGKIRRMELRDVLRDHQREQQFLPRDEEACVDLQYECERISLPSQRMAYFLAKAQEISIQQEDLF